jgi:predicted DNA-binding transcriptional regulator AlpA
MSRRSAPKARSAPASRTRIADDLLDQRQAATPLGLPSARILEAWRRRGYGPPFLRLSPRLVRYRASDIDRWLAARVVGAEQREASEPWGPRNRGRSRSYRQRSSSCMVVAAERTSISVVAVAKGAAKAFCAKVFRMAGPEGGRGSRAGPGSGSPRTSRPDIKPPTPRGAGEDCAALFQSRQRPKISPLGTARAPGSTPLNPLTSSLWHLYHSPLR